MTPTDFLATLSRLGLSQSQAAALLGVSRGAVTRWVKGERAVPGPVCRLILALDSPRVSPRLRPYLEMLASSD